MIFVIFGKAEIQPWNEVDEIIKTSAIRDAHEEDDEKLGEVSMTCILAPNNYDNCFQSNSGTSVSNIQSNRQNK